MGWIEMIDEAIGYIESNITSPLTIEQISRQVCLSPFYFQKGFSMLCGYTVGEYIRQRRLSLAGSEVLSTDEKIIDIAVKYGYESPDSFSKAFTRFHGFTPSAVRKDGAMIKSFSALKIKLSLEGGLIMNYKIMEKDAFTVIGKSKTFKYDNAKNDVPKFWADEAKNGIQNHICTMYGVNIDEKMGGDEFEYIIADDYDPKKDIPEGFITKTIPKFTWAVFACKGAMPKAFQETNQMIFSQWLPSCNEYEIAAGYNIEMYSDPADFENGVMDDNYYSEIWIPVKRK